MVGKMNHPQAREALPLLMGDANADVAVRAVRAAARRGEATLATELARVLRKPATDPHVAAEAARALAGMDTPEARSALAEYTAGDREGTPHRQSLVVEKMLERLRAGR